MKIKALSLLIAICMMVSMIPGVSAAGIEDYPALTYGVEMTLSNVGGEYAYVTFTPETSGSYRFYSLGNLDTTAKLCDAQMNQLAASDDCYGDNHGHGWDMNFCIIQELVAGNTYVLGVKHYGNPCDLTIGVGCVHIFVPEITKKPTCSEPGIKTYTCTKCGYSESEEITVPHSYVSENVKKPTCAEPGVRIYTCTVCGDSYSEETTAPHSYVSEIIHDGNCGNTGTVVTTCDVCGDSFTEEYIPSHSYVSEVIKAATCTEDGIERYTCTVCGDSLEREIGGRHEYKDEYILGSCTKPNMQRHICIVCGYSFEYEVDEYNHNYQKIVLTEPTCTKPGTYVFGCTVCGDNDGIEELDPLGHVYNADLTCIRCGEAAPTEGNWEHMSWTLDGGVLTITGVGEMPKLIRTSDGYSDYWIDNTPWKDLPVREAVIGEGITNIAAALFEEREELQKVTLPGTLETIGESAFTHCAGLTAVVLPEGLTEIGNGAFLGCGLTEIDLPESLRTLGTSAFYDCGLRQVHIPAGTRMGDDYSDYNGCFDGNRNLERITVAEDHPMYCTDDRGALYSKDMTELYLIPGGIEGTFVVPAVVTGISADISGCAKLDTIEVEAGNTVYFSLDGVLCRYTLYTDRYEMDNGRIYLRYDNVLKACPPAKELGSYTIDAEIGMVQNSAFHNCVHLTELTIPAACAFDSHGFGYMVHGCTALQAVLFEEGHPDYFSDANGLVYNVQEVIDPFAMEEFAPGEALMYLPAGLTGQYSIPEGIRYLNYMSLISTQLSSIRFPKSLEVFGSHVLMNTDTVEQLIFTGDMPFTCYMIDGEWAEGVTADIYYPAWLESWSDPDLYDYECDMTYIPYEEGKEPVWGEEEPEKPENPFTDVPAGSFYAEPVAWAVENNITTGASANSFNPDGQCLRAHVVTFLWRAEGCPEPKSLSNPFVDVKETDFYFKAVLWAVENKITNGSDATHFNPFGVCNRAQVVTFLHRAKGSPAPASLELPFTDVPAGTWYAEPIAWAVEKNITNGLSATQFGPNAACNRAQVVTFLYRAYVPA